MFDQQTNEDARIRMESLNLKGQGVVRGTNTADVTVVKVEETTPLGTGVLAAVEDEDTPLGTVGEVLRQAQVRQTEGQKPRR